MRIVQRGWRALIPDTPCARCGHPHNEKSFPWDEWPPSKCHAGGWVFKYEDPDHPHHPSSMVWCTCQCPVWVQPELCFCGKPTNRLPMTTYLNGIRACSVACALEGQRRMEAAA